MILSPLFPQTVSVISSAILALLLHPEIQAKAQAEIDAVVGTSRLPDFEDRGKLPYLEAILTETLRWIPVLPLCKSLSLILSRSNTEGLFIALPHRSIKDDVYEGYFIPGGECNILILNI